MGLQARASITSHNAKDETALDIARQLQPLQGKASSTCRNAKDETFLDIARQCGVADIVAALEGHEDKLAKDVGETTAAGRLLETECENLRKENVRLAGLVDALDKRAATSEAHAKATDERMAELMAQSE